MKDMISKRLLVKLNNCNTIYEIIVLEVSPAGEYVKIKYITSCHVQWYKLKELSVLEVL